MDKYFVIVAGTNNTSRANVEALVEDYVYANGNDVTFIFPFNVKPAQGQIFVAQWAKDKSKDIIIFSEHGASLEGMPAATYYETATPYKDAANSVPVKSKVAGFVLYDEDNDTELVDIFYTNAVHCYDLTAGLKEVLPSALIEAEDEPEEAFEEESYTEPTDPLSDELYKSVVLRLIKDGYITPSKAVLR